MDTKAEFLDLDLELDIDVSPDEVEAATQDLEKRLARYDERKLAIQRSGRQAIEQQEVARAELQRKHLEEVKRIETSICSIRDRTAEEYETVCRLAASTRAALEALQP